MTTARSGDASGLVVALREFCGRLKQLHSEAGGPPVKVLGADPGVPLKRTQLHEVLSGRIGMPPSWDFVRIFVGRCQAHAIKSGRRSSVTTDLEWWRREHAFLMDLAKRARVHTGSGPEWMRRAPASQVLTDQRILIWRLTRTPDGSCRQVGAITGDIRQVRCADVWVNSENTNMAMARIQESSISAIIRYEGSVRDGAGQLIEDLVCNELEAMVAGRGPHAPATVVVTGAGNLKARNGVKHIIHVAAVHGVPGSGFQAVKDIARCVDNALVAAEGLEGCRVILFPLLGTGVGGAPPETTAQQLIHAAVSYMRSAPRTRLSTVLFLAYTDLELRACQAAFDMVELERVSTGEQLA